MIINMITNHISMNGFKNGCSLVTCAMNRTDNLLLAIKSWGELDEVSEIIVLDWSSEVPIQYSDLSRNCPSKDIKLIRVENQPKWILSHAFNLGASFVQYDKLLKLDADILLSSNFLSEHFLSDSSFYRGNWKIARDENELHLNGQLYCKTKDFWRVNGYHEGIVTYGWDDSDIYNRLSATGLTGLDFNYDLIKHIESSHEERHRHQDICDLSDLLEPDTSDLSDKDKADALEIANQLKFISPPETGESVRLFFETQRNRIWAELNPWLPTSKRKSWDIVKEFKNFYICNDSK